jgi:hypothetical protein
MHTNKQQKEKITDLKYEKDFIVSLVSIKN